ncbi:zinc finger CCCH domain-containing protein 30-like [Durio zibethinus]|uniref:Zinc finger CCCH domain-containing protein 30-like n=1 Tax=Durio zibethinus TaxID=66656 RepID=A0A6P5YJ17_DURZI|nr:zinc finger CCCH domain-containing protein 30-like [Durio zibethinus]
MKRSRKSNRVSWAPGVNLCQVKLFLREDCPSKVGGEHQDSLQAKTSWALHPSGMCANDPPPGFEGHYAGGLKYDLAKMPRIKWTCPPKFVLNFNWHVAAGEESKEVVAQKLREMRVHEAVYPCLSVIPPSPSISVGVELDCYDHSQIPPIPLTPIEDEEGAVILSDLAAQAKTPSNSKTPVLLMPPGLSKPGTQHMQHCPSSAAAATASSDAIVAVSAALTAIMKSKEQGSLIDTGLLVKILSDPKMVDELINNHGYLSAAANGNVVSAPVRTSEPETGITSSPCPKPASISSPMPADRNSNHLPKEFQPTISIPASRADIISVSMPTRVESSVPVSGREINMISGHKATNGNIYSTLNQVQSALSVMPVQPNSVQKVQPAIGSTRMRLNAGPAVAAMKANPVKDANYIKNLIREHGIEKQEAKGHNISQTGSRFNHIQNLKLAQNLKPMALKTKFRKPCIYFNSSKGCRQGSNCPYLHEKSFQCQTDRMLEAPSAKRMKIGWEVTGRI